MSYYLPDKFCIIIASHISKANRIPYLIECLSSLVKQTIPVNVYLSISFDTDELRDLVQDSMMSNDEIANSGKIIMCIRDKKTPQMRHIEMVYLELEPQYEWILFCDDDDTYSPKRVETFAEMIAKCYRMQLEPGQMFVGAYESTFGKDHREHRHEYWCYCVRRQILERFLDNVRPYPDILDNKCCDVLFAECIRRSRPEFLFVRITDPGYNYRVENNDDSVTGFIKTNQKLYSNFTEPPSIESGEWATYVINLNEYLHENISVYLHDTYLRTLIGVKLDDILNAEFKANAPLLEYVDVCHVEQIKGLYDRVCNVCDKIYDMGFV
jgi:hypothetical protein